MVDLAVEVRVLLLSLLYAAVGIGLLFAGYRLFDYMTPSDAQRKIFEEGNVAVGVLMGLFILALAIVIAAAISG